jgi:hypothetical protein
VYAHIRLDTNTIFYVGKGKGNRAYKLGSYRSKHWNRIALKYGYCVEFLEKHCTESEAFRRENYWICQLKDVDQCECNYTLGGEGISGYQFTKKQRKNLSNIQKSENDKIKKGHLKQAEKLKGRTKETHLGIKTISIKNSGVNNGRAIWNVITPEGTFETIKKTAEHYNVSTALVHKKIKLGIWNRESK